MQLNNDFVSICECFIDEKLLTPGNIELSLYLRFKKTVGLT